LLNFPAPLLYSYSQESAIAEKFQAMIALGEINSLLKDLYDVWLLVSRFPFDEDVLIGLSWQLFNGDTRRCRCQRGVGQCIARGHLAQDFALDGAHT
jgi:hypothetical protein